MSHVHIVYVIGIFRPSTLNRCKLESLICIEILVALGSSQLMTPMKRMYEMIPAMRQHRFAQLLWI